MKKIIPLLLLCIIFARVQSQHNTDSLQQVLQNASVDQLTLQYYLAHLQTMDVSSLEEARLIGDWIIQHTNTESRREIQASAYFHLGKILTNATQFAEAARYLTQAQSIAEEHGLPLILAQVLNALGSIYQKNDQWEKSLEYYQKSLDLSNKHMYLKGIARAKYNLGNLLLQTGYNNATKMKSATQLMREGLGIVIQLKDTQSIITQTNGLAGAYASRKKYDSALFYLADLEKLLKLTGKEIPYLNHYVQLAKLHNDKNDYEGALKYYNSGLQLAEKYETPRWLCMYYSGLAETYEKTGDYKKANLYNQLNIKMHDELVKKENFAAAADIQNKYERAKKDNEILVLASVNKQKSTLNKILIGSSAGLAIISFLGYRNFKNRNKISRQQAEIQRQKIAELEKESQLLAIDAMLKGQEEERSRIAKDLHDGLGGLLSGTKLSLLHVKDSLALSKDNLILFDKSLSMLDNTIGDLRKVAHNLMPEALVKFGLTEAVRDYCDSIRASGIDIVFQQFGEKRKYDNTAEVFIYRIIQELVNNAIKHADASQILVQLSRSQTKTEITVEDDGKGFDKALLSRVKGSGLANVNYRVQYFNGRSDIISSPNNGTSVNIELIA